MFFKHLTNFGKKIVIKVFQIYLKYINDLNILLCFAKNIFLENPQITF